MDISILISPEELKVATTYLSKQGAELKPVRLEAKTKSGKKVILEYDVRSKPLYAKSIQGRIENDALVLKVYEELWKVEASYSLYNKDPVQDRYDGENKAVIYSTVNLPNPLKHFFGIKNR